VFSPPLPEICLLGIRSIEADEFASGPGEIGLIEVAVNKANTKELSTPEKRLPETDMIESYIGEDVT